MSIELIAMLGGGVSGFIMKMIAAQAEYICRVYSIRSYNRTLYSLTTKHTCYY